MCPSSSKDTHREEWRKRWETHVHRNCWIHKHFLLFNFLIYIQLLILTGHCVLLWYPRVLFSGQIGEATTFVTSYIPFLCGESIQNPLFTTLKTYCKLHLSSVPSIKTCSPCSSLVPLSSLSLFPCLSFHLPSWVLLLLTTQALHWRILTSNHTIQICQHSSCAQHSSVLLAVSSVLGRGMGLSDRKDTVERVRVFLSISQN